MKRFLIYKYDPGNPKDEPKYVSYYVDLKKILPCIWTLSFMLKITSIQPSHSEDHADKVFADHARWTAMDSIHWPVSDKLTVIFQSIPPHHTFGTHVCFKRLSCRHDEFLCPISNYWALFEEKMTKSLRGN